MYRYKINLVGYKDVVNFVNLVSSVNGEVDIVSGRWRCTAKSLLFGLGSLEWGEVWCESEVEVYHLIKDYIIGEST